MPEKIETMMEIRGRDLIHGLPKNIKISSNEMAVATQEPIEEIIFTIKAVLRETPPELSADIMDKGMILSGGGALLRNIDQRISQATGVPSFVVDDPLTCVARGAGVVLESLDIFKQSIMSKK